MDNEKVEKLKNEIAEGIRSNLQGFIGRPASEVNISRMKSSILTQMQDHQVLEAIRLQDLIHGFDFNKLDEKTKRKIKAGVKKSKNRIKNKMSRKSRKIFRLHNRS